MGNEFVAGMARRQHREWIETTAIRSASLALWLGRVGVAVKILERAAERSEALRDG